MQAILIHGMGRTPVAMMVLAHRLRTRGLKPVLFGYSPTFETWNGCLDRYCRCVDQRAGAPYVVVGHSLGTVLMRAALARLSHKPGACFLLAPPVRACLAARKLASLHPYRWLFGEMGQLLADEAFMASLPVPDVPTRIYAGDAGPVGRFSPFGEKPNDGILMVDETRLDGVPMLTVPASHTFIMNRRAVAEDIVATVNGLVGRDS